MLQKHLIATTAPMANAKNIIVHGNRRITVLTPQLFRIETAENSVFCDQATQAVWFRDTPPVNYQLTLKSDVVTVATEKGTLYLKEEIHASLFVFPDGKKAALSGEGNLLGTYRTLDCCDGDLLISYDTDQRDNRPIRLEDGVVSRTGVALYDDSRSLLLGGDGMVMSRENPEQDLYVFAYGQDYRGAVKALYMLCGAPAPLPRYALGNWWSRYHAYTAREYLELMEHFEEDQIPFTVATIDMDWHPSENLPQGVDGWTGYSWNRELFPDYRDFLRQLKQKDLHVTLNLHPARGVQYIEDQYEEMAQRMGIDPATRRAVAFDFTDENFINAYFSLLHKPYEKDGVDFWWIDWQQGTDSALEGYDPLWGLNHYHSLDIARDGEQLILSRYAGIGSHRYPVGFSGDTLVTWKTLRYLPYFTATASNAGYTWWSHDIGGHMNGIKDDELFVRFVQFGVFSPVNRLHSTKNNTFSKMPDCYKNGTGEIVKRFLRLRHQMIPFLYSAVCENAEQGLALIEPMYYAYPRRDEAYNCPGQYLFGRELIVAPITEKSQTCGMSSVDVWLPEGMWTDIFTGHTYMGGGWRKMTRFMDSLPVLARQGGFLVLDGAPKGNPTELPRSLRVLCHSGDGEYSLYEDGEANGQRARAVTRFQSVSGQDGSLILRLHAEDPRHLLPARSCVLELRNVEDGTVTVLENGKERDCRVSHRDGYTRVHLEMCKANVPYEIRVQEQASPLSRRNARLQRNISLLEWDNGEKAALADALCQEEDQAQCVTILQNASLPGVFKDFLMESLI